jgi:hypothetical protein
MADDAWDHPQHTIVAKAHRDAGPIHIIFDGPPSHESGRFVEVETPDGKGINVGEWVERDDGLWALVIPGRIIPPIDTAMKED